MKTNIILIDFENVQPKDLAQLRGRPFKTKVFCGANQTKIPLDLAAELHTLGPDAEYIRIQGTGPNALDFHIAYYIGRLSAELQGATFHIVSKDKGFDPDRSAGRHCQYNAAMSTCRFAQQLLQRL